MTMWASHCQKLQSRLSKMRPPRKYGSIHLDFVHVTISRFGIQEIKRCGNFPSRLIHIMIRPYSPNPSANPPDLFENLCTPIGVSSLIPAIPSFVSSNFPRSSALAFVHCERHEGDLSGRNYINRKESQHNLGPYEVYSILDPYSLGCYCTACHGQRFAQFSPDRSRS